MKTILAPAAVLVMSLALAACSAAGGVAAGPNATPPTAPSAPGTPAAPTAPAAPGTSAPKTSNDVLPTVTVDGLAMKLDKKEPVAVFDANTKDRFEQGHIPGAKWVDATKVDAAALPTDHAQPLVFYCANTRCSASHQAANQASSLGYQNVAVLSEGIVGWEKAGKPLEK